jgi:N-methylhydantoinase A
MFVAAGIDIGGTFTDCVLLDSDGRVFAGKASTTRGDLLEGFFNAIHAAALAAGRTGADAIREVRDLAHGTTVATNIMVQNAGARVGLLTTRGHADAVTIQRSAGRIVGVPTTEILDLLAADKPHPLVDRTCIVEIDERVDVDGDVIARLDPTQVESAIAELVAQGVDAVAIAYLWSFRNARHENESRDVIARSHPGLFLSISHEVSPSWGEYERSMTAVINSYVGIETGDYLGRMRDELTERGYLGSVAIMESTGGVADPLSASRFPVRLILSGPAGALVASADLAAELELPNVITSDMGGTSFDVGLVIAGSIVRTDRTTVGRYEIQLPSVDVRSIGSGGGSIAWVDDISGGLRVGPRSAAAMPGPAAYGRGGTEPTVTDADLVLGYLDPDFFLGGALKLDRDAAAAAVKQLAPRLGVDVFAAAAGIRRVVDSQMADAIRLLTLAQGHDPRDFTIFAFGGAGPVHAADYARELGITRVVVPRANVASAWSAYGAASADAVVVEQHVEVISEPFDMRYAREVLADLRSRCEERLRDEGAVAGAISLTFTATMKYRLQIHALDIELELDTASDTLITLFEHHYEERYGQGSGYRAAGIEITGVACRAAGQRSQRPAATTAPVQGDLAVGERFAYWPSEGRQLPTRVFRGEHLHPGWRAEGPAVLDLPHTTVVIPPGDVGHVDRFQNVVLELA